MGLRPLSVQTGESLDRMLAEALGIYSEGIAPDHLAVAREFAFSSDSLIEFAEWYLRAECFSKYSVSGDDLSRAEAALDKFKEAEAQCHRLNERLVDPWSRASLNQDVWKRARALIGSVLGPFPWEELPTCVGFGPGASTEMRASHAFLQNKWALSTHITEGALPYYAAFIKWARVDGLPVNLAVVDSNRVFTVPKRYDIDRTCAAEPTLNMFFQKGVGRLIRRRLCAVGLLHPDAQCKNQALARLGSWTNSLATLDVKSASELVTLAVVEALLPDDWVKVLMDLRSPVGTLPDGSRVTYGKISSMGNGFTFELETLVFWALTVAASGKRNWSRCSVYGDDIICPAETADAVTAILAEAGFQTNDDKSFVSGPFRESCGGHYWNGQSVAPFYARHSVATVHDSIVRSNAIAQWVFRHPTGNLRNRLMPVLRAHRKVIPRYLWGPIGVDGCLWSEWDQCTPTWDRNTQSYKQAVITQVTAKKDFSTSVGGLLHGLWSGTEEAEASFGIIPRRRLKVNHLRLDRNMWKLLPVRLA